MQGSQLKIKSIVLALPLFIILGCSVNTGQTNKEIQGQVKKLLSEMTLEEKVGQMTQVDFSVIAAAEGQQTDDLIDQARLEDAVLSHHVGSILNAPSTPHNKAQPL